MNSIRKILLMLLLTCFGIVAKEASICDEILGFLKEKKTKQVEQLVQKLQPHTPCLLQLFPRYYWGQNMTHIFVKFQFLNSADTSACDHVLSLTKTVEHNKIYLALICTQSSFLIRYSIAVTTFMPMNFYQAQWKQAQQNTLILQCQKSPNPYFWKRLYLPDQAPLRKPKIWWTMVERYMEDTKKFIYDLHVQEEETDVSAMVKKSKRKRMPKDADINPFSNKYLYCNHNNPFQLGSWVF